jgi:hypothetical protein
MVFFIILEFSSSKNIEYIFIYCEQIRKHSMNSPKTAVFQTFPLAAQ